MKLPVTCLKPYHLLCLVLLSTVLPLSHAQVESAAKTGRSEFDVFGAYKYTHPDLIRNINNGITYGAEFKLNPVFGVRPGIVGRGENDFSGYFVKWDIYTGGPEFHFLPYHALSPYGDILFGLGRARYRNGQTDTGTTTQLGGGATYRLNDRFSALADFQYHWIDMGTHRGLNTSFTPYSVSVGIQYRIF